MDRDSHMYNDDLSFCIPTFNRAEILAECLEDLIKKIGDKNFEIIVSDNNSSDSTEDVVKYFQSQYPRLRYYKQDKSCDVDKNFASVLSISDSRYTWLIGDSYRIEAKELDSILDLIVKDRYALILVNSFDQVKSIQSGIYTSSSKLLNDLGWYLPIMSAYIYKKDLLNKANYERYYGSNFLQMGITFEYLENNKSEVYWYAKNGFGATSLPKKSWHYEAFNVFAKNWVEFVLTLPRSIELSIKLKCIKDHGENYGVFSGKSLLFLRQNNWLNYRILKKYKLYLKYVTTPPLFIVIIISILPKRLIRMIWKIKRKSQPTN